MTDARGPGVALEYDDRIHAYHGRVETGPDPAVGIAHALSTLPGVGDRPLYHSLDLDALAAVLRRRDDTPAHLPAVSFTLEGYRVTVLGSGHVFAHDQR